MNDSRPWFHGEPAEFQAESDDRPRLLHRAEPSSADFHRTIEEILARIERGEFQKVVPVACEELEFSGPLHAAQFAEALKQNFPNQYRYGFEFAGEGFVGVTPELLFSVKGDRLTTMALAGTGRADGPSLLDDEKERHEHALVIEHIVQELKPWGRADVGATCERTFGVLKHLYTPIELKLQEAADFMKLVVRLHPTAALGGWPRKPAVEWLERQSFHVGRGRFGAPFGLVTESEMTCVVAIRGLQWNGKCARLAAGCGVVQGSEAIREWEELKLKRRATAGMLGLEL